MTEQEQRKTASDLERLWEEHIRHEFSTRSTDDTLETMVEDAYVDHVPVLTGGSGHHELRQFYSTHFIPKMPPDMAMTPLSRTIGTDQLVDEMVIRFTHTIEMDWMLPGIAPTGRPGEVALAAIVRLKGGTLAHEPICWDQASLLPQLGRLEEIGRMELVGFLAAVFDMQAVGDAALEGELGGRELVLVGDHGHRLRLRPVRRRGGCSPGNRQRDAGQQLHVHCRHVK